MFMIVKDILLLIVTTVRYKKKNGKKKTTVRYMMHGFSFLAVYMK